MSEKKRVKGIGGIFFQTDNPDQLREWYARHLGMETNEYGATFKTRQWNNPDKSCYLQWSTMSTGSDHFSQAQSPFMVNYRVDDLEWLVGELKKEGVTVCDEIATYDYGKFVHILDPDGNKIELWEPVDEVFDQFHKDTNDKGLNVE